MIEVIDHYTYKQIENEHVPYNDEYDEVNYPLYVCLPQRLHINALHIDATVHYLHPSFGGAHLEQSKQTFTDIVEIRASIGPLAACCHAIFLETY